MAEANEAPAVAQPAESEAQSNTNQEQAPAPAEQPKEAPDMHGFTSEQLAEMKKFYDANGGFEKVKSRIANPEKPKEEQTQQPEQPKPQEQPQQPQTQPVQTPAGAVTSDDVLARVYFQTLAQEKDFAPIAKEIADGSLLKEMNSLGISTKNPDGSFNDSHIRAYLGLKAQTVPAQSTSSEPEASTAPTVDYVPVGETINNAEEAYAVLQQDAQLKASGQAGHPAIAKAEEYLKKMLNPEKPGKK